MTKNITLKLNHEPETEKNTNFEEHLDKIDFEKSFRCDTPPVRSKSVALEKGLDKISLKLYSLNLTSTQLGLLLKLVSASVGGWKDITLNQTIAQLPFKRTRGMIGENG